MNDGDLGVRSKRRTRLTDARPDPERLVSEVFRAARGVDAGQRLEFACDGYRGVLYLYEACAISADVADPAGSRSTREKRC